MWCNKRYFAYIMYNFRSRKWHELRPFMKYTHWTTGRQSQTYFNNQRKHITLHYTTLHCTDTTDLYTKDKCLMQALNCTLHILCRAFEAESSMFWRPFMCTYWTTRRRKQSSIYFNSQRKSIYSTMIPQSCIDNVLNEI